MRLVPKLFLFLASLGCVAALAATDAPKTPPPAKKSTPPTKTAGKAATARKANPTSGHPAGVVAKTTAAKPALKKQSRAVASRRKSTTAAARPQTARRNYQQAPTGERYKEIQQALAEKGYFRGSVDGQWGPDSVDAMKRFQADQNLDADGKLSSLSLIALGLGPKHLTAQTTTPARSEEHTSELQ